MHMRLHAALIGLLAIAAAAPLRAGDTAPPADRSSPPEPIGSPAAWVSADDYPRVEFQNGFQGRVGIRLSIDKAGKAYLCDVTGSSGSPGLDKETCIAALAKARFRPARNENGEAVHGSYSYFTTWINPNAWAKKVVWSAPVDLVLPVNRLPSDGSNLAKVMQVVTADGTATSCRRADDTSNPALARAACGFLGTMKSLVIKDTNGTPVPAVVMWSIGFTTGDPGYRAPPGGTYSRTGKPALAEPKSAPPPAR